MDEAATLFLRHGYEGTSLRQLADVVGMKAGSLYYHFASKDALYGEVFERLLSDWFARLAGAIESTATGWPKVEQVLRAGFDATSTLALIGVGLVGRATIGDRE